MPFGEVTITCNPNVEADLAGYRVYSSTDGVTFVLHQQFTLAQLNNPAAPSMQITNFTRSGDGLTKYGLLYFSLTAYDDSNNESPSSAIVSKGVAPKLNPLTWP